MKKFDEVDTTLQLIITICSAYLSYLVAEHVCKSSGILSCVFDGLVLAHYAPPLWANAATIHAVWEAFEFVGNTLIFELSGILTMRFVLSTGTGVRLQRELPIALLIYVSMIAIRCVVVAGLWPLISRFEKQETRGVGKYLGPKEAVVMAWGGLRGAVGLALAISLGHEIHERKHGRAKLHRSSQLSFHVSMMAYRSAGVRVRPTTRGSPTDDAWSKRRCRPGARAPGRS